MEKSKDIAVVNYSGGGIREQHRVGKGFFKYMPAIALRRLAQRYEYGAIKYGASDNFKKGLPTEDCLDSAFRHLNDYMLGDNSEDHLAACVWNCFTIMEMEVNNPKWQNIATRKKWKGMCKDYTEKEIL